jgi:acetyl esterase/lipase
MAPRGFNDTCAPSSGSDTRPLVAALASLGYVAIAPDYIGLRALNGKTGFLHPYLVGEATAIASLDAVRAANKLLAKTGGNACARPRFATIGGSQGGHAALWVDRLAPYYAKELEHVGVVATVPPADMLGEGVRALRTKVPASGNMAAFYGAASDWYGVRGKLSEVFVSPLDTEIPTALGASCSPDLRDGELSSVFTKSLLDAAAGDGLAAVSPWGCMLVENGLTTTSIPRIAPAATGYGVLFVLGENDTLVDPETERKSFDTLCSQGMKMQYLECAGASHTQATIWALSEIIDFVRDRFSGKSMDAATVCKRSGATRCRGTM